MSGLYEVTEDSMIAAHKSGRAYWTRNRPWEATTENIKSLARSLGHHDGDQYAFVAGFFGEKNRASNQSPDEGRSKPPVKWTPETARRRVGGTMGT